MKPFCIVVAVPEDEWTGKYKVYFVQAIDKDDAIDRLNTTLLSQGTSHAWELANVAYDTVVEVIPNDIGVQLVGTFKYS